MGSICNKAGDLDDNNVYETSPDPRGAAKATVSAPEQIDSPVVDKLVQEMLVLLSCFYDNTDESPPPLMKIHGIADKELGWIQVIMSMIKVIPLSDPLGPSTITMIFDDCPLPSKLSIAKVLAMLNLNKDRALARNLNIAHERNICIILGCIADMHAGPACVRILTEDTLDYLVTFLVSRSESNAVLYSLIALEKFAHTRENKATIMNRLNKETVNPLLDLEQMVDSGDYIWRQVGFCAQWILDNLLVIEGRALSHESADMSRTNVILNSRDVSEYLKISPNGLEARSDAYSFESVRSTFEINEGCWYFECTLLTPGVMQIGWATEKSRFLNQEGYGVGDDHYSLAYDGCRQLVWYRARSSFVVGMPKWQPGDILGCLLDLNRPEAIFSLNGKCVPACTSIFSIASTGFFPAASFMAFQQCRFNFGLEPFMFPPKDREFKNCNEFADLTAEDRKVIPRRIYLEELMKIRDLEDSCTLCCDNTATCVLDPCGHRGFCPGCSEQLKECPICRGDIGDITHEEK